MTVEKIYGQLPTIHALAVLPATIVGLRTPTATIPGDLSESSLACKPPRGTVHHVFQTYHMTEYTH